MTKDKTLYRKCSAEMPEPEQVTGVPYMERWVIYCACGTTIFGNSKEEAESSWKDHKAGLFRC